MVTSRFLRVCRLVAFSAAVCAFGAGEAEAQLGALMSPGPLARAHKELEGLANCQKCHEPGRRVTAERCLTCHKPVAERIARRAGVHRNARNDCVTCHVDHAGEDGELRPFDTAGFDHRAETGFALDGKHVGANVPCGSCHKTRSFLKASPACGSCHTDTHKGTLGNACERCHSTRDPFTTAKSSFNHDTTAFALTGAHKTTDCTACHKAAGYKVVRFDACSSCHATPHGKAVSTTCTSCHTTANWTSRTFDHARTAFPLVGRHQTTACAACHKAPAARVKPPSGTCAACHADPHRGEFARDCGSCHTEKSFSGAPFDHVKETGFALEAGHGRLTCKACHKGLVTGAAARRPGSVDFRGLGTTCASCHADPHASELGATCERCHSVRTFAVAAFDHPKARELFVGPHAAAPCAKCHTPRGAKEPSAPHASLPVRYRDAPVACASCHADVHLGQVSTECQACHSITATQFAPDRFAHARTRYPLTGRHEPVPCVKCHAKVTGAFPSGTGTATRLTGLDTACASCHADVHLGQLATTCERCHTTASFLVNAYTHREPARDFFVGRHRTARCGDCHKRETGQFATGHGTTVRFAISASCVTCHEDPHRGALGNECSRCHRPEPVPTPTHVDGTLPLLWRTP